MARIDETGLTGIIEAFRQANRGARIISDLDAIIAEFEAGGNEATLKSELRDIGMVLPREGNAGTRQNNYPARSANQAHNNQWRGGLQGAGQNRQPGNNQGNNRPAAQENLDAINPHLNASYRFIGYDPELVIKAEAAALGNINVPKPDGLNAEIVVHWTAESPLLIGEKDTTGTNPLMLNNQPIIPGSTLRGAIRSVAEVIGGARLALEHVNHSQSFALRDFEHAAYANDAATSGFPVGNSSKVYAGWLTVTKGADPNDPSKIVETAKIEKVEKWYKIEVTSREKGKALETKYADKSLTLVSQTRKNGQLVDVQVLDTASRPKRFRLLPEPHPRPIGYWPTVEFNDGGTLLGHYVFSDSGPPMYGPRVDGRRGPLREVRWEYVFQATPQNINTIKKELQSDIWLRFKQNHSKTVGEKLKADGAWATISEMLSLKPDIKIPVFYVGDLEKQSLDTFAFGLTRLFKAPHKWTLDQVVQQSGVFNPIKDKKVDEGQLDMVDALFGYVYKLPGQTGDAQSPDDLARKGRVSFSLARLLPTSIPKNSDPLETVEGSPQPTFAPFYLAGATPDYSAIDAPKIAGRKRYPARNTDSVSIFQRLKDRAEGNDNEDSKSKLTFLGPENDAQPLVFESRIRLANVTKAELGLVVSALTLGGNPTLRHAIGRAKNEGAGRVKAEINTLTIEYLAEDKTEAIEDCAPFVAAFHEHIAEKLQTDTKRMKFRALADSFYVTCDPSKWNDGDLLDNATHRDQEGKFKAIGFKDLRKQTKRAKRNDNQYGRLQAHLSLLDSRRKRL